MCLAITGCCAGVLTLAAAYLYLNPQIPEASSYRNVQVETPLRVLSRDGTLLAEYGERRAIPITMDQVPELFVRALVDTEDKRFYSHRGVDLISLVNDTIDLVLDPGGVRAGASTLTMQLARNVSFSLEQTFLRKFKEMLLALKIERQLSKQEILNLYINLVPFGKRAYGAEAAAQTYYGTSLTELDLAQLAMLAGIPQAPSTGNPINGPERALARRNVVLSRMLSQQSISREQYDAAVAAPITATLHRQGEATAAPYAAELVRRELLIRYPDLYTGGYEAITTIESPLQQRAIRAVRRGLHEYDERYGYRGAEGRVDVPELQELPALSALLSAADARSESATRAADAALAARPRQDPVAAAADILRNAAPLPAPAPLPEDLQAPIREAIVSLTEAGNTFGGVVLASSERSLLVALEDGRIEPVLWTGLRWAAPYVGPGEWGAAPEQVADIVQPGDLVRLRDRADGLRLTQIPEVQGALSSIDPVTGAIRALTGGYDFDLNQYNHAVQARRQPGSGFKPFVYSAALDAGITPASVFMDAPIVLQDEGLETEYRPDNVNKRYNGPTRLREALYRSINLVSIRVLLEVGAGRVLRYVNRFGFDTSTFPRNTQLGIGGGTMGVNTLEMARAFSVFANGGFLIEPHLLLEVRRDGEVLETLRHPVVCEFCLEVADESDVASAGRTTWVTDDAVPGLFSGTLGSDGPLYAPRTLDKDNAYVMHTMLQDVVRRGTGRRVQTLGRTDLAAKTGTTNDAADTWFNGYNGSVATAVWVGFSDNTPLGPREFGATTALPIWVDYMAAALDGVPATRMEQPETVVSLKIDPQTGEVARPGQRGAVFEYFLSGHLPEDMLAQQQPAPFESDALDEEDIDTTDIF